MKIKQKHLVYFEKSEIRFAEIRKFVMYVRSCEYIVRIPDNSELFYCFTYTVFFLVQFNIPEGSKGNISRCRDIDILTVLISDGSSEHVAHV